MPSTELAPLLSEPLGKVCMLALRHLMSIQAYDAAMVLAVHDQLSVKGLVQSDLYTANTVSEILATAIVDMPRLNDYLLDMAGDTVKSRLSKVFNFVPEYHQEQEETDSDETPK